MFPLCKYCKYEVMNWKVRLPFCSVQCRLLYVRYEKQINQLRYNLLNKIYVKADSIRVRKYRDDFMIDKII